MSDDYDVSDEYGDYYSDEDMIDGTQGEESSQSEDDVDMDDDYCDDFKVSSKSKRKPYEVGYTSLSQTAVESLMRGDVEHICEVFGVDATTASLLLRHLCWNKERLIEKYMDNPPAVRVAAGVSLPEPPSVPTPTRNSSTASSSRRPTRGTSKLLGALGSGSSSKLLSQSTSPSQTPVNSSQTQSYFPGTPFTCPICFDDTSPGALRSLALHCGHSFCTNCWVAYLTAKVTEEAEQTIRCMAEGCALVAPDDFVRTVLTAVVPSVAGLSPDDLEAERAHNHATLARFESLLIRDFVACNPNLKYCPYPECTNTVSCPGAASKMDLTVVVPIVSCGARGIGSGSQSQSLPTTPLTPAPGLLRKEHKFCFGCPIESDHRPVVCAAAKMWLRKCRDDSETANWIKSNTKECSNCQSTIEKNGGCNHMTCKKCKHEFCWVCMGPWSEHGTAWYTCNRYDEKAGVEARDAQSRSRASLERYLHYYNRWANHEQSAKLSIDLYAKTEKKMEDMQITSALTWIEVQFMKKAVEEVEKCRMTLKWTYAMAYYLAKGNQKDLFEDNQRDLEKAVEDLSELLEGQIEPESIPALRQKVTDKTVYVQKRNEIVLEDTAAGFMEGRWRWNSAIEGFDEPEKGDLA